MSKKSTLLYVIKVILLFWVYKFASELVAEAVVIAVHFACGLNPLQGEMFDEKTIMIITYLGHGIMIGVIFLLWKFWQKKSLAELGFTKNAGSYLIGAAAGAVLPVICVGITTLTGAIKFNGIFTNIDYKMVAGMLICFMLQGAMEEILCRGVVQQLLIMRTSFPVSAGISTVLFIIPHISGMDLSSLVITAVAIVNLILISVIFSLLTLRFKSIWAACGMHSLWNYILYSILGLNLSGNEQMAASVFDMRSAGSNILNGGIYGIEASIITTAVLGVAATALLLTAGKSVRK